MFNYAIKNMKPQKLAALAVLILLVVLFSGCAANHEMYEAEPAGFWAGLWHGLILLVTFIINLFTDSVGIYEVNNSGAWYNFGFLLGVMMSFGHGGLWRPVRKSFSSKCRDEEEWEEIAKKVEKKVRKNIKGWVNESDESGKEWEEIAKKVEKKVRKNIKDWVDESDEPEKEWEEIGKKVEEKIKREIRNWAEK